MVLVKRKESLARLYRAGDPVVHICTQGETAQS